MDEPRDDNLDLRSLKCPLPAMLAKKALARLNAGARLTVLADDPMALVDIPHMCHHEGHALEDVTRHASHAEFHIRAKAETRTTAIRPAEAAADGDPAAPPHLDRSG
jgi:tRNA 2-thiouridine synthesizing protein A